MSFLKDFDTLLNELLTDWQNQFPAADTSHGSLIYIKSACLASALWGIYRYQEWISKQIFPDTADTANLDRHGWVYNLNRKPNESNSDYLERLLTLIRQPPAGGNKQDYINWVLALPYIKAAYCFPLGQGLGTVDVLILCTEMTGTADATEANKLHHAGGTFIAEMVGATVKNTTDDTETMISAFVDSGELTLTDDIFVSGDAYAIQEIPNQLFLDIIDTYIQIVRPVTASVSIQSPSILLQDVTMTVTGSDADLTQIATEITSYLNSLEPNETLYIDQLKAIAIQNGADAATVTTPASDVTPSGYQMIRAGTINVS